MGTGGKEKEKKRNEKTGKKKERNGKREKEEKKEKREPKKRKEKSKGKRKEKTEKKKTGRGKRKERKGKTESKSKSKSERNRKGGIPIRKRFLAWTASAIVLGGSITVAAKIRQPSAAAIELRKAHQATHTENIISTQVDFPVYVNGRKVTLEQPVLKVTVGAGTVTFLPLRSLAKVLGVEDSQIYWNEETCIASLEKDGTVMEVWDGGNQIVVNGSARYIYDWDKNVKAFLSSDSFTYLPLRVFSENLPNIKIYFELDTHSIVITTDGTDPKLNLPAEIQNRIHSAPIMDNPLKDSTE